MSDTPGQTLSLYIVVTVILGNSISHKSKMGSEIDLKLVTFIWNENASRTAHGPLPGGGKVGGHLLIWPAIARLGSTIMMMAIMVCFTVSLYSNGCRVAWLNGRSLGDGRKVGSFYERV